MINGHGNDIYNYPNKITADFSSNIYHKGMPGKLKRHLMEQVNALCNYPEPDAGTLQHALACHLGIQPEQIQVTNGSTEAFYLLAHLFKGKSSAIRVPSFSEYEAAGIMYNHDVKYISGREGEKPQIFESDVLWLGNPNNPDGRVYSKATIAQQCILNPDTAVILDEAYAELCHTYESCIPLLASLPNLIIVRSLTKSFAIPGLRLGYIVSSSGIQARISQLKMPWSINALALKAGEYIIKHYDTMVPEKKGVWEISTALQKKLNRLKEIRVIRSDCNFFLVKLLKGRASDLKKFLIDEYGLLIRDASNFRTLDSSYFRIAVQEEKHNQRLTEGIRKWMQY